MSYIALFFVFFGSLSFAEEIKWKEIQIPYNYVLKYDLQNNSHCKEEVIKLVKLTKEKNPSVDLDALWAENFLKVPRCKDTGEVYVSPNDKYSAKQTHSANIIDWEKITASKNFILSKKLDENLCSHIWQKQIGEFKKKNTNIKNPNVIPLNEEIYVQICGEIIKEDKIVEVEEIRDYIWFAYLSSFSKNSGEWTIGGGLNLNLKLIDFIDYEMNALAIDQFFLFHHFGVPVFENEKENIFIGATLANNMATKSFSYFFVEYKRKFGQNWDMSVQLGNNLSSSANYVKSELGFKNWAVFHKYFMEKNLLDKGAEDEFNHYNVIGFGLRF